MTTLAATALRDVAAVRLVVTSATDGSPTLTRTDVNGTHPVRLRDGQELTGGSMTVVDYEAALTGLIVYELVHDGRYRASARLDLAATWLTVAVSPNVSATVPLVTGVGGGWGSTGTVHKILDRDAPVVIGGRLSTRAGTLRMIATTYEAALAVALVYRSGQAVLLRQPDHIGLDLYHVVTPGSRASLDFDPSGAWTVTVDYTEVDRPVDPLLGDLGWSFDDVAAAFPDFDAVRQAFPDFAALTARGAQLGPDPVNPDPTTPPSTGVGVALVEDETGAPYFDAQQTGRRVLILTEDGTIYYDLAGVVGGGYVALDGSQPYAELGA